MLDAVLLCGGLSSLTLVILFFSVIFLVDLIIDSVGGGFGGTLSIIAWVVGVVSAILCILLLALFRHRDRLETGFAITLGVVWLVGVIALTFSWGLGTFNTPGNGYFATWICVVYSVAYFRVAARQLWPGDVEAWARRSAVIALVLGGSVIELIEAAYQVTRVDGWAGGQQWGVIDCVCHRY